MLSEVPLSGPGDLEPDSVVGQHHIAEVRSDGCLIRGGMGPKGRNGSWCHCSPSFELCNLGQVTDSQEFPV